MIRRYFRRLRYAVMLAAFRFSRLDFDDTIAKAEALDDILDSWTDGEFFATGKKLDELICAAASSS